MYVDRSEVQSQPAELARGIVRLTGAIRRYGVPALVTLFVVCHGALLISTATGYYPWVHSAAGAAVRDYEALTGADNTFNFFAPHVASQAFTEVTTVDRAGVKRVHLYDRARSEGELRLIAFSLAMQQQKLFDLLAYSLATSALRADDAQSATVRLGYYEIPKLASPQSQPLPKVLYLGRYIREASATP
jgi:hypothetical protein